MKLALAVVGLFSACGYRFTAPGGPLPQGIRAVKVPVMNNVTAEPSAETFFTQALRDRMLRAGTLGDDDAEARLEGTVLSVAMAPMAVSSGRPPTYRLTAVVELRLLHNGAVITATQVSGDEDVLSGVGTTEAALAGTEANRAAGLRRLAESMMREGYEKLCTGW